MWNVFVLTGILVPVVNHQLLGTSIEVVVMGYKGKLFACLAPKNA